MRRWRDVDLRHGRVNLEKDKTNDPRDWDLRPDVVEALARWKQRSEPHTKPEDHVFSESGVPLSLEQRATFVTVALATSRTVGLGPNGPRWALDDRALPAQGANVEPRPTRTALRPDP
jgi:hypothetical protein